MDKITVIGFTSSGKTSYLAGMYGTLSYGQKRFTLKEKSSEMDLYFQKLWDNIRLKGEFPGPSDKKEAFTFSLLRNIEKIREFEWLDYPGRILVETGESLNELGKQLSESVCLFLLVNGESFAFNGNPEDKIPIQATTAQEYMNIVAQNLMNNHDLQAIKQLSALGSQGIDLPPIAIVLTKSDLIEDKWFDFPVVSLQDNSEKKEERVNLVQDILHKEFISIFGAPNNKNERIVMVTDISLGYNHQGRFIADPMNVELPIAFGVLSILRQDVIKNKQIIVQNQNRMNELQKNWFSKWLYSDVLDKLREDSDNRAKYINEASVDIINILELFENDKPIYINDIPIKLKDFFKK